MFGVRKLARSVSVAQRSFSSSSARRHDVAKLTLIGRLGKDPELKTATTNREYITYSVATVNYPPPPPHPDGTRPPSKVSWHHIYCFNPATNDFLKTLTKGTTVYVEANYELREPDASAEPGSHQAARQIFLRHETLRVLRYPPSPTTPETSEDAEEHESSSSSSI